MKKYTKLFLAVIVTLTLALPIATVSAQNSTVDDSVIEESLREEGLNERPGVVEVEDSEMSGQAPSSGWVDENGKPLSDEEYAQYLKDQEGIFKKYPWLLPVIVVAIAGIVVGAIKLKKKK